MQLDPSIHHATRKARKLLRNGATIVTQIVESVRLSRGCTANSTRSYTFTPCKHG
jgi:hypothetical protein